MEIAPAAEIAFREGTPVYAGEPVARSLGVIYEHIRSTVVPALTAFL
jgi:hypothetical protein